MFPMNDVGGWNYQMGYTRSLLEPAVVSRLYDLLFSFLSESDVSIKLQLLSGYSTTLIYIK